MKIFWLRPAFKRYSLRSPSWASINKALCSSYSLLPFVVFFLLIFAVLVFTGQVDLVSLLQTSHQCIFCVWFIIFGFLQKIIIALEWPGIIIVKWFTFFRMNFVSYFWDSLCSYTKSGKTIYLNATIKLCLIGSWMFLIRHRELVDSNWVTTSIFKKGLLF